METATGTSGHGGDDARVLRLLWPIIGVVFVAYLVIGLALPVLPLHITAGLGLGPVVVGMVAGSQFAAAVISRVFAGHQADSRGPRRAVVAGLIVASIAGIAYLASLACTRSPAASVTVLLAGRGLLGAAESFIITGALSWGLLLAGPANTGKVMAWVGTALWAAFAVGAPLGSGLYAVEGFRAIALATVLLPLVALVLVARLSPIAVPAADRTETKDVLAAVWVPGLGLALSGIGFGAITTFITLLYAAHGWGSSWLPFTAMSLAFLAGRIFFGHLPDRVGGARVALVCVLVEAVALASVWLATSPALVLAGVALTGLGYSLVYPGFGVEALRRAPPRSRDLAMGLYTAFLDVSLAVTSPLLGLIASAAGLSAVFLASAVVVLGAVAVAVQLLDRAPSLAAGAT